MNAKREPQVSRDRFLRLTGCSVVAGLAGTRPAVLASANQAVPATVAIVRSTSKGEVQPGLAGLSYDKLKLSTEFFTPANSQLIGCFRRLGTSVLRIGGSSADEIAWVPNGVGATRGQVAPGDVTALAGFLQSTGWQVIYGINLGKNTPAAAAAEASFVAKSLGSSLYGFEIGNECDEYAKKGIRPATYSLSDFIAEWAQYAAAIRQSVPDATLTGPASSYNVSGWTVPFALSEGRQIKLLTQHYYRGNGKSPASTMAMLLASDHYLPKVLTQLQSAATSNAIRGGYRLAEANSLYSGGAANVSNAYGSALWTVDFLLTLAAYGCAGANLHGGGDGSYNPYYAPIADFRMSVTDVRPVYYGMLFVSQIANGPMYETNVSTTLNLSAYAVAGRDRATYVAIVNKDPVNAALTSIGLGAPGSEAEFLALSGPALDSLTGTTLGEATVATDGSWSPKPLQRKRFSGTTLTVNVAPASALLLKVT